MFAVIFDIGCIAQTMKALLSIAVLAASAYFGSALAADPGGIRATELIGKPVITPRAERLGEIAGLLLDTRRRGVHYALLATPEGDERFAYPLNAFRRGGAELVLDVRPENLAIAPGYRGRSWPDMEYRSADRYIRAARLLGRQIDDPLGNRVGDLQDLVVSLGTGATAYYLVDFEDGGVLPMPEHAVRLHTDRAPTLEIDADRRVLAPESAPLLTPRALRPASGARRG